MSHYIVTHPIGYRSNRDCHTALKYLNNIVKRNSTTYIIKADISGFFDNINHNKLLDILEQRIQDKYFLMYIQRWLERGILKDKKLIKIYRGTPQGDIISPVLGNVYLDDSLDNWFENYAKHRYNNVELLRYCDDFICCCNSYNDATAILDEIVDRLAQYDLKLSDDKTKIVEFKVCNHPQFNFLGFSITHSFNNTVAVKTSHRKFQQQIKTITELIQSSLDNTKNLDNIDLVLHLIDKLNEKLRGWYSYYRD